MLLFRPLCRALGLRCQAGRGRSWDGAAVSATFQNSPLLSVALPPPPRGTQHLGLWPLASVPGHFPVHTQA